jgi:hypothetical protein
VKEYGVWYDKTLTLPNEGDKVRLIGPDSLDNIVTLDIIYKESVGIISNVTHWSYRPELPNPYRSKRCHDWKKK